MDTGQRDPLMPSAVEPGLGWFDRLASRVSDMVARAWFFFACLVTVLVWAPSYWLIGNIDTWQLIVNTFTTIITFLLVALLQNTESRADKAVQRKLNAIAQALADLMEAHQTADPSMGADLEELRQAVGLEHREGSS